MQISLDPILDEVSDSELASSDVPLNNSLSSSDHMVGRGIWRGRNLIYSVHGVEAHPLEMDWLRLDRTI